MRSKVKIDIHYDNQPVVRVIYPEQRIKDDIDDIDVRDKLVEKFISTADYVKNHSAYEGIAGNKFIRRGAPCILEHWANDEYIIKPIDIDVESLELLKEYIDTLIHFEKNKYGSCGGETINKDSKAFIELRASLDSDPNPDLIEEKIKTYLNSKKEKIKSFVFSEGDSLKEDIKNYISEFEKMDRDLRAAWYLNILSRITPAQRFEMATAGLMPTNLTETLKFLEGDKNPDLFSNLERITSIVKPERLFANIGHAENNLNDPKPGIEYKEEDAKYYNV